MASITKVIRGTLIEKIERGQRGLASLRKYDEFSSGEQGNAGSRLEILGDGKIRCCSDSGNSPLSPLRDLMRTT